MKDQHVHVRQRRRRLALLGAVLMFVEGCASHRPPLLTPPRAPGAVPFTATAYCHGTVTAAGLHVRPGIVAADPTVLPIGATIRIERSGRYDGVYMVLDTGPKVRGRQVDVFIDNCAAAKRFGRKRVRVTILNAHD